MTFRDEHTSRTHREPTEKIVLDRSYREAATRPCNRNRGSLLVLAGPAAGEVVTFDGRPVTIGRARDCELHVQDTAVSRYHAICFRADDGRFLLEDLGSANGTWYAAQRVHRRVLLHDGDRFLVGTTVIAFHVHDLFEQRATRRMRENALRDALTGLWNRRYFDRRLRNEMSYSNRHGTPLALMLFDIDHFKAVNDQHGHLAGDAVLAAVASRVRHTLRPEDVVARFGGEEIAVLSRGIGRRDALVAAERVRAAVEGLEGSPLVTLSAGVAWTDGRGEPTARGLVTQADEALYRAKEAGRNTIAASWLDTADAK